MIEVDLFEADCSGFFAKNRRDGAGWEPPAWADRRREWMAPGAYRCLPLTIANQLGLVFRNPVGFTATIEGPPEAPRTRFAFDGGGEEWGEMINDHFGPGIVTWIVPYVVRTRPSGSCLYVCGPVNGPWVPFAAPLSALVETSWRPMSFTYSYRLPWRARQIGSGAVVAPSLRFERGAPVFQAIPLASNPGIELEGAVATIRRLDADPAAAREHRAWAASRAENLAERGPAQGHYLRGETMDGEAAPEHALKVRAPRLVDETRGEAPQ